MTKEKIIENIKAFKIHIIILALGMCVFLLFFSYHTKEIEEKEITPILKKEEEKKETYFVDIKGAIQNPNVYEMEKKDRVKDVIEKAGGLKENASTDYINMGKKIKDEMIIIIYTKEEIKEFIEGKNTIMVDKTCVCPNIQNDGCLEKEKTITNKKEKQSENKIININTATKEQLETLTGIGSTKAKSIIEYRDKTPFTKIEDIKNVKGIGDSIFDKIKNDITI